MTNDTYRPFHTYIESTVVTKPLDSTLIFLKCALFILTLVCVLYLLWIAFPHCKRKCKRRETEVNLVDFDNVCID